jgi:hypothetical protein
MDPVQHRWRYHLRAELLVITPPALSLHGVTDCLDPFRAFRVTRLAMRFMSIGIEPNQFIHG